MARKRIPKVAPAVMQEIVAGQATATLAPPSPFPFEFDTSGPTVADESPVTPATTPRQPGMHWSCWSCRLLNPVGKMACGECGAIRDFGRRELNESQAAEFARTHLGPAPRPIELPDLAGAATIGDGGGDVAWVTDGPSDRQAVAEMRQRLRDDTGQFLDELADSNDGDSDTCDHGPGRFNLGHVTAGEWTEIIESSKRAVEDLLLELKRHSDSATICEEREHGPIRILEQEIGRLATLDSRQARQLTATKLKLAAAVERLEKLRGGK